MNFGEALETLKRGGKVQRGGWNGKGMWLALQVPNEHSKMTLPYIFMSVGNINRSWAVPPDLVPWVASQADILAEDWSNL